MYINRKIILWIVGFGSLFFYIASSYLARTTGDSIINMEMVNEIALAPQRMFFVNNMAFAILIYCTNLNILKNESVVRYKNRTTLFLHIQITGALISLLFITLLITLLIANKIIVGVAMEVNILFLVSYVCSYCFFYYQVFMMLFILTKKPLVSLIITSLFYIIILCIYYYLVFSYVVDETWVPFLLDIRFNLIGAITLIIVNYLILKKEDIICVE